MAISDAQLRAALKKNAGVYVLAANELGVTRQNVSQRVARSAALRAYVEQIEEEVGDAAEAVIKDAIIQKDRRMARWYAQTKLKHRGYTTRTEHTAADGAPLPAPSVQVEIRYVDAHAEPAADEDVI